MRCLQWALVQHDWHPCTKGKLGHRPAKRGKHKKETAIPKPRKVAWNRSFLGGSQHLDFRFPAPELWGSFCCLSPQSGALLGSLSKHTAAKVSLVSSLLETVDPWTAQGVGALRLHVVENSSVTYRWSSSPAVFTIRKKVQE